MTAPLQNDDAVLPTVTPVGVSGVLVSFAQAMSERANAAALAFHRAVQRDPIEGIAESAPSLVSVFLRYDPVHVDPAPLMDRIKARVATRDWSTRANEAQRCWHIPACFDGPQFREMLALTGCTADQAIAQLTQTPVRVLALGFAPGQPYMGTLPQPWDVPRLQGIAPNVPEGALVTAVRQLIVFANASPTGWRHIGNCAFRCFDVRRGAQAIALAPGDAVQFHVASAPEIDALRAAPDGLGGARLEDLA